VKENLTVETTELEYWGKRAKRYGERYHQDTPLAESFKQRKSIIFSCIDNPNSKVLLDAGCGPGVYTADLISMGVDYWGIDGAEDMINMAKAVAPEARERLFQSNVSELPFDNDFFDIVILPGVIEYLPEENLALQEIRRVLKQDGQFIFSCRNRWAPANFVVWMFMTPILNLLRWFKSLLSHGTYKKVTVHWHTKEKANKLLEENGFEFDGIEYYSYAPIPSFLYIIAKDFGAKIMRKGQRNTKGWRRNFCTAFVVKATKVR